MKPYNKLENSDKELILCLYYEGLNFVEIGLTADVSKRSISRVLQEKSINTKRKNRYSLNEDYFTPAINNSAVAYFLGILAADGCVTDKNYIALQMIDEEIVRWFADDINFTGDIRILSGSDMKPIGQDAYRVNFSSAQMASHLRALGVQANKNLEAIPDAELMEPSIIPHFIRGYFDGDGSVYLNANRSGGTISIVASESLCRSLKEYFKFGNLSQHPSGMWYWKIFSQKHASAFYETLYDVDGTEALCLQRKKKLMEAFLRNYKYENYWKTKA